VAKQEQDKKKKKGKKRQTQDAMNVRAMDSPIVSQPQPSAEKRQTESMVSLPSSETPPPAPMDDIEYGVAGRASGKANIPCDIFLYATFIVVRCVCMMISLAILVFVHPETATDIVVGDGGTISTSRAIYMAQVVYGLCILATWAWLKRRKRHKLAAICAATFVLSMPVILMVSIHQLWAAFSVYICVVIVNQAVLLVAMIRLLGPVDHWMGKNRAGGGRTAKILDWIGNALSVVFGAWLLLFVLEIGLAVLSLLFSWI
jgi:hypothetical protein